MSFKQKELNKLLLEANEHFYEFVGYNQAAYHCMCDRGHKKSIGISLEIANLIGKLKTKLEELNKYKVIENE